MADFTLEEKKVQLDLQERHLVLMQGEIKKVRRLGGSYIQQHYGFMGTARRAIQKLKHEIQQLEGAEHEQ